MLLFETLLIFYALVWLKTSAVGSFGPVLALFLLTISFMPLLMGVMWKASVLRRAGYDTGRILYETLKQPKGWLGWYPRRLRAKGDVWDRLPPELRHVRTLFGLSFIIMILLGPSGFIGMLAQDEELEKDRFAVLMLSVSAVMLFCFLSSAFFLGVRWRKRARAEGFEDRELVGQMSVVSTAAPSFWLKPAVARMLSAAADSDQRVDASLSPLRMADAISRMAARPGIPARDLAERALVEARKLVASIEEIEKEIGAIASSIEPTEADRLTERLGALVVPASMTADPRQDVRDMLQKQLELVRNLERRLEDAKRRRAQRIELLKTLWLQVTNLSAAESTTKSSGTAERIRLLIGEIGTHLSVEEGTIRR